VSLVFRNSAGHVYLRFETIAAAMSAQRALHGRWFAGKMITTTYMVIHHPLCDVYLCSYLTKAVTVVLDCIVANYVFQHFKVTLLNSLELTENYWYVQTAAAYENKFPESKLAT
jgi:hypothetical protein